MPEPLTRSTAHRLPPLSAWLLALAYWRLHRRRAEQLTLLQEPATLQK